MDRKYLMIKVPLAGELVVTFMACVDHSYIAKGFEVVSAGKFNFRPACFPSTEPQIVVTHGSTTLGIVRDPAREEIDAAHLDLHLRPR